jgi:hypothetical protein
MVSGHVSPNVWLTFFLEKAAILPCRVIQTAVGYLPLNSSFQTFLPVPHKNRLFFDKPWVTLSFLQKPISQTFFNHRQPLYCQPSSLLVKHH